MRSQLQYRRENKLDLMSLKQGSKFENEINSKTPKGIHRSRQRLLNWATSDSLGEEEEPGGEGRGEGDPGLVGQPEKDDGPSYLLWEEQGKMMALCKGTAGSRAELGSDCHDFLRLLGKTK